MLFFFCVFQPFVYANGDGDGFKYISPLPTGNEIHDIWTPDGNTYFFACDAGTILKYSGGKWEFMDTPTDSPLFAIHGISATDIWAVGGNSYGQTDNEKSVILHYDGTAWSSQTPPDYMGSYYVMRDVFVAGSGDVWGIADYSSYLCHYNGTAWEFVETGLTDLPYNFYALYGFAADDIYVAGGCDTILHYDGTDWTMQNQYASCDPTFDMNMLYDVWGTDENNIFACGNGGQIFHLQNKTLPWIEIHEHGGIFNGTTLNAISGSAADNIFFTGNNGVIWHYNGSDFSTIPNSNTSTLNTVIRRTDGKYIMAGIHGRVDLFDGTNLSPLNTPVTLNTEFKFNSFADGTLWVSPDMLGQGIYSFNGRNFTQHPDLATNQETVTCLSAFSNKDVWLGERSYLDLSGTVHRYNGSSWSVYAPTGLVNKWLSDVIKTSSGDYFGIVGDYNGGQPCKIMDDGLVCYTATTYTYRAITEADDGTLYAVADGGIISRYSNGSWSDEASGTSQDLVDVAAGGGWVYAVGNERSAVYKESNTTSWNMVSGIDAWAENPFINAVYAKDGISYATLQTNAQYIGGNKGYIYKLHNGTATKVAGGLTMLLQDLTVNETGDVLVTGNNGFLYGQGEQWLSTAPLAQPWIYLLLRKNN